ncbi:MAG: DUF4159 domain-containing protein [Verrucomicrobiota bacterium]|nr:DUF4159 domain-containing protein [Verrucomicrobiota bacterium]
MAKKNHPLDVAKRMAYTIVSSRFFILSVLIHVVAIILLGAIVIIKGFVEPVEGDFEATGDFIAQPPGPPPPPPAAANENEVTVDVTEVSAPTKTLEVSELLISDNASAVSFMPEIPVESTVAPNMDKMAATVAKTTPTLSRGPAKPMSKERLSSIAGRIGGKEGFNVGNGGGGVGGVSAQFTCYVAKYAGGDWSHNVKLVGDRIVFGSIPNLMTQITRWNKNLKANIEAKALDLASEEIFSIKPPAAFVYMTGHKDFKLTNQEVQNLQRFIVQGGVIWGDNGLPGRNSRFDIAFRREMRRVLPDPDQELVAIDEKHEVFTQSGSKLKYLPTGMNFYKEPIEVISVNNKIAVFYTLNSYGDLWQVALDKSGHVLEVFDEGTDKKPNETFTSGRLWGRRNTYYRGISEESVTDAYKLGINVTVFLLLQYQDELNKAGLNK